MAYGTVLRPNAGLRVRPGWNVWVEFDVENVCMTFEAKLPHGTSLQHFRIRRAMRGVARGAPFGL